MSNGTARIAGIQFAGIPDQKEKNLDTIIRLIRKAESKGAQIIVPPEAGLTGFVADDPQKNSQSLFRVKLRVESDSWPRSLVFTFYWGFLSSSRDKCIMQWLFLTEKVGSPVSCEKSI